MTRASAALSWDGARLPPAKLPVKARAFLGEIISAKKFAALLTKSGPLELRICWVPRLRGGTDLLVPPFATRDGRRVCFRLVRTIPFGSILGAVYRR